MHLIRRTLVAASALALATWAVPAARAQTAYVDMDRLFQSYYKTARYDGSFKKQKDLYAQHVTDGAAIIEQTKKQLGEVRERSLNIALSDEVRGQARKEAEEREGQIRDKQKELKDFLEEKDKELGRKYLEMRAEIVKELSEYIRNYAEREKLEMIMDVSGMSRNYIPVVVYYQKSKDITDKLLAEVNKGHEDEVPKDIPAAGTKPEPGKDVPPVGGKLDLKPAESAPAPAPLTAPAKAEPKAPAAPGKTN